VNLARSMQTNPEKLLKKHRQLVHSDMLTVTSHVQRTEGDWIINTLMVEGCTAPFRFKRKQPYGTYPGCLRQGKGSGVYFSGGR